VSIGGFACNSDELDSADGGAKQRAGGLPEQTRSIHHRPNGRSIEVQGEPVPWLCD